MKFAVPGRGGAPLFAQALGLALVTLVATILICVAVVFNVPPPPPELYKLSEISRALKTGQTASDALKKEINLKVRDILGPHATPEKIQFTEGLPKTRSGKIMRRILRKIAENELDNLGDPSTLADPAVVESLVKGRL